jgi:hypothetical protein
VSQAKGTSFKVSLPVKKNAFDENEISNVEWPEMESKQIKHLGRWGN